MRQQEIWERFQKEIDERQVRAKQLISEMHQKNGIAYEKNFSEILVQAFTKFSEYQQSDDEKKMKYIQVNCLRVALETETYEYLIRIMDEYGYIDVKMVEIYYIPQYLPQLIATDKEYFTKLIMSKVIRAKRYEIKDFLREYLWNTYIKHAPPEIAKTLPQLDMVNGYDRIVKTDEVEASYGEIFEKYDTYWLFTSLKKMKYNSGVR